jgi:hypothetical protein
MEDIAEPNVRIFLLRARPAVPLTLVCKHLGSPIAEPDDDTFGPWLYVLVPRLVHTREIPVIVE